MEQHTVDSLRTLIEAGRENDAIPEAILAAVKELHGKAVNFRHLEKMPGGSKAWRITKEYARTRLDPSYLDPLPEVKNHRYMVADVTTGAKWDAGYFEKENGYASRRQRNANRDLLAANTAGLQVIAKLMNEVEVQRVRYLETVQVLTSAIESSDTWETIWRYQLQNAVGIVDARYNDFANPLYKRYVAKKA